MATKTAKQTAATEATEANEGWEGVEETAISAEKLETLLKMLPAKERETFAKRLEKKAKKHQPKGPELVDVKAYFPEPQKRQMSVVVLKKNGQVARRFTNDRVWDANKGEHRAPKGLESGTAKHKLRVWLSENPAEYQKLEDGAYRLEIRYSRVD